MRSTALLVDRDATLFTENKLLHQKADMASIHILSLVIAIFSEEAAVRTTAASSFRRILTLFTANNLLQGGLTPGNVAIYQLRMWMLTKKAKIIDFGFDLI